MSVASSVSPCTPRSSPARRRAAVVFRVNRRRFRRLRPVARPPSTSEASDDGFGRRDANADVFSVCVCVRNGAAAFMADAVLSPRALRFFHSATLGVSFFLTFSASRLGIFLISCIFSPSVHRRASHATAPSLPAAPPDPGRLLRSFRLPLLVYHKKVVEVCVVALGAENFVESTALTQSPFNL